MGDRERALFVVLIQPACFCWHAGGIRSSGEAIPLLRSEPDDLIDYQQLELDAQLSFLRHRFAGVLQRGCDRLFTREMRANHFVLIADGHFRKASEALTERLGKHLTEWMMNPPVTYMLSPHGFVSRSAGDSQSIADDLHLIAGDLPSPVSDTLREGLPDLVAKLHDPNCWELILRPQSSP